LCNYETAEDVCEDATELTQNRPQRLMSTIYKTQKLIHEMEASIHKVLKYMHTTPIKKIKLLTLIEIRDTPLV